MSIISKETWDKFTQEEKERVIERYNIFQEQVNSGIYEGTDKGGFDELKELFPAEALQPKQKKYWEIEEELFNHRANQWLSYYIIDWDKPHSTATQIVKSDCTSRKQAEKLLAINKLLNIAKFLNKDWKPDWSDDEDKWSLCVDPDTNKVRTIKVYHSEVNRYVVYFRTEKLAEQAIQILGEDTVRLALTTDF